MRLPLPTRTATITTSTFSNNSAHDVGGGHVISGEGQFLIFEVAARGNLTINNLTLRDGDNTDKGKSYGTAALSIPVAI